ncbi:DUF1961 family protein [Fundicoccus sp. Sow4_H7]|uniref:DUF1961 family protein n=1 Tax=Fundicoccus sp. Sow4_H7 TaxID=3438784 RepID=UPI003F9008A6
MKSRIQIEKGDILYSNDLSQLSSTEDFIAEGEIEIEIIDQSLVLSSPAHLDPEDDHSHWVFWNKQTFPADIVIEYSFKPLEEPGLSMLFFAASGRNGEDLFSDKLKKRDGYYPQYHSGDINTYHLSYFRRKWDSERSFHTCNLRKSHGFHLVEQGADPLPAVSDAIRFYRLKVMKYKRYIQFYIDDLFIFEYEDRETSDNKLLNEGKIGFRQMAPLKGAYRDLVISEAKRMD